MLPRYAVDKEDKESFPPERLRYTSLDAWTYKTAEQLGSSSLSHWGLLALYSGGGYTQVGANNIRQLQIIFRSNMFRCWRRTRRRTSCRWPS